MAVTVPAGGRFVPTRIRVLLVVTPALFRHSLAAVLARRRRLEVIGEAETRAEAMRTARHGCPDVVIVDPDVPECGPELVAELCHETVGCAVLVLTHASEDGLVGRALEAGARGYLDKQCEIEDLVRAIERVHLGDLVVSSSVANTAVKDLTRRTIRELHPPGLSARQLEVIRLVARGHTNQEIARALYITEHTVKAHLAKILGKLSLENRVQLATYALEHGLLDPLPAPTRLHAHAR
jgi:DNA-binding NarL/FixJ family response regulator